MTDWSAMDAQLRVVEAKKGVSQDRRAVVALIKRSALRPNPDCAMAQKMGGLITPDNRPVAIAYEQARPKLWFCDGLADRLRAAGFQLREQPPWDAAADREGRHSGLKNHGFRDRSAWDLLDNSLPGIRAALAALGLMKDLILNDETIDRWVAVLQSAFPGFRRFDPPHEAFDATETAYKLDKAEELRAALNRCSNDEDFITTVVAVFDGFNLLNWRTINPLKQPWPQAQLGRVIRQYFHVPDMDDGKFVSQFIDAWMQNCPTPQQDHPRQIAGLIAMLLHPDRAVYFRRRALDALYRAATGQAFPRSDDPAQEFANELQFARAVEQAFADRGLAPRNLLDVQSALWVIHDRTSKAENAETTENPTEEPPVSEPLNTILYGPPGTGKTFATAERAVRICDGTVPGHADPRQRRAAIMARYHELCAENRVAFVTFHQSYGYEEFVEGLRPVTDDGAEGQAGFRLEPADGTLKVIADRARRARKTVDTSFDTAGRKVFKVSVDYANSAEESALWQECFAHDCILTRFGGPHDWTEFGAAPFTKILKAWQAKPGKENATGRDWDVVHTWSFRSHMAPGDIILLSRGTRSVWAVGVVEGDYEFVQRESDDLHHRRAVSWRWIDQSGQGIPVGDLYENDFARHLIHRLAPEKIRWPSLLPLLQTVDETAPKPPHVLIIDEINRANVSKVMGELITLLEEDKREGAANALSVILPHSRKPFSLPGNLHILGTMNTADRSIALLDTALRRRFRFESVAPDPTLLEPVQGIDLRAVLETINARLEYLIGPDHLIGHGWMMGVADIAALDRIMADKIIPLLREYFHDDLGRVRAVLGGGNAFLRRVELAPPPGLDDGYGEIRYRYEVNRAFGPAAYQELLTGTAASEAAA
ncbi:AAA family ATPase [Ruegeria marisrubri]|uniref:AAA family ATPase n=1 Tax=Ruegeria marisrubri TaxID=1685379 RepID=UPI001CD67F05|nr:AAA family ATPase [Ruegeria marisrubri]MCA0906975.1 AAA family ATPase [Ruegeria marisrubri]